jgi:hypothetical protein
MILGRHGASPIQARSVATTSTFLVYYCTSQITNINTIYQGLGNEAIATCTVSVIEELQDASITDITVNSVFSSFFILHILQNSLRLQTGE